MKMITNNRGLFNFILSALFASILIISFSHTGFSKNSPPVTNLSLSISSCPEGADLFCDGVNYGKTPIDIPINDRKTHLIRLDLNGYDSWETEYSAKSGLEEIDVPLHKTGPKFSSTQTPHLSLKINSNPEGADIIFDGANCGKTPTDIPIYDQENHSILLKLNGYDYWEEEYNTSSGLNDIYAPLHKIEETKKDTTTTENITTTEEQSSGFELKGASFIFILLCMCLKTRVKK